MISARLSYDGGHFPHRYTKPDGSRALCTVVKVHYDDPPPYYSVTIDGQERSTVRHKLTPIDAAAPPAAAPAPGPSEGEIPSETPVQSGFGGGGAAASGFGTGGAAAMGGAMGYMAPSHGMPPPTQGMPRPTQGMPPPTQGMQPPTQGMPNGTAGVAEPPSAVPFAAGAGGFSAVAESAAAGASDADFGDFGGFDAPATQADAPAVGGAAPAGTGQAGGGSEGAAGILSANMFGGMPGALSGDNMIGGTGLSASMFGGAPGVPEVAPPPPVAAAAGFGGDDDGFGDFGGGTAAANDDDFGDFGGGTAAADDDGFGDFGGGNTAVSNTAAAAAEPTPPSTDASGFGSFGAPPSGAAGGSASGVLSADLFADPGPSNTPPPFEETPLPIGAAATEVAAPFGAGGEARAPAPAPEGAELTRGFSTDFTEEVGGGDDGFAGFDVPVAVPEPLPPAVAAPVPAPESVAAAPAAAAAGFGGDDDGFGDFGGGTAAAEEDAWGDFGGGGAAAAAPPTAEAAGGSAASFDAAVAPSAGGVLSADLFAEHSPSTTPPPFGGEAEAPPTVGAAAAEVGAPLAAVSASGGDDDFGGFGGGSAGGAASDFGAFGGDAGQAAAAAPSAGGVLSADMFGGSTDALPTTSAVPTADAPAAAEEAPAAVSGGDDDFGGFGGGSAGGAASDFGGFGGGSAGGAASDFGGFGGFDTSPVAAAAPAAAGSAPGGGALDFGGFGDELAAPPAGGGGAESSRARGPSFASLAADEDDAFSSVPVVTPAAVFDGMPAAAGAAAAAAAPPSSLSWPPAAPSLAPSAGASMDDGPGADLGLQATFDFLVGQERYAEAVACKAHIGGIAQLSVHLAAYEKAKEDDELEEAMHLKKVVLPAARAAVQPDQVVRGWQRASPAHRTLAQMRAAATAALGEAEAAPFLGACCARDLAALAASSLPDAAAEHARAAAALGLLLELPPAEQARRLANLDTLLAALLTRAREAAAALSSVPAVGEAGVDEAARAAALRAPRVAALVDSLAEVRRVGGMLAASCAWHASIFAASAGAGLGGRAAAATASGAVDVRDELAGLLRTAVSVTGLSPAAGAGWPDDAEEQQRLCKRCWAAAVGGEARCALSLLPLRCDKFPEMPPTVRWAGRGFLAPCANLWVNAVRGEPPA